jgi:hypothetical protein
MKDIEQHSMVIFVNTNILDNGTGITNLPYITLNDLNQLVGYVNKERIGQHECLNKSS